MNLGFTIMLELSKWKNEQREWRIEIKKMRILLIDNNSFLH